MFALTLPPTVYFPYKRDFLFFLLSLDSLSRTPEHLFRARHGYLPALQL